MRNSFEEKLNSVLNLALERGEVTSYSEVGQVAGLSENECKECLIWLKGHFPKIVIREMAEGGFVIIGNTRELRNIMANGGFKKA